MALGQLTFAAKWTFFSQLHQIPPWLPAAVKRECRFLRSPLDRHTSNSSGVFYCILTLCRSVAVLPCYTYYATGLGYTLRNQHDSYTAGFYWHILYAYTYVYVCVSLRNKLIVLPCDLSTDYNSTWMTRDASNFVRGGWSSWEFSQQKYGKG